MLHQLEMEKKLRNIKVPTNDREVKLSLRQLGHAICLFGEDAEMRRDRLKTLMQKIYQATGEMVSVQTSQTQVTTMSLEREAGQEEYSRSLTEVSMRLSGRRVLKQKMGKALESNVAEERVAL